jgi:hypothetical protein
MKYLKTYENFQENEVTIGDMVEFDFGEKINNKLTTISGTGKIKSIKQTSSGNLYTILYDGHIKVVPESALRNKVDLDSGNCVVVNTNTYNKVDPNTTPLDHSGFGL